MGVSTRYTHDTVPVNWIMNDTCTAGAYKHRRGRACNQPGSTTHRYTTAWQTGTGAVLPPLIAQEEAANVHARHAVTHHAINTELCLSGTQPVEWLRCGTQSGGMCSLSCIVKGYGMLGGHAQHRRAMLQPVHGKGACGCTHRCIVMCWNSLLRQTPATTTHTKRRTQAPHRPATCAAARVTSNTWLVCTQVYLLPHHQAQTITVSWKQEI
jgi:hypothetical protein